MKDWLYPDAKVVCVKSWWGCHGEARRYWCPNMPVEGQIYTVREVLTIEGILALRVNEVVNPPMPDIGEPAFRASDFRPLTKRSTDAEVSKLKRLLNTTPADLEREGV